jgi:hypothetical protein
VLLDEHALEARWHHHPIVVCEGAIEVGGPVAVFGQVGREPFAAAEDGVARADTPYREMGTRPLLTGSMAAPLLLIPAD